VGGTFITDVQADEQGWGDSGGGFSFAYKRPSYQESAVSSYLASGTALPDSKYYNSQGRGFPDVSAIGTNYNILVTKSKFSISGTSASTPVIAGVVALLNHYRLSKKMPPLGRQIS
jgi:tripeptidyl-peptidase-1